MNQDKTYLAQEGNDPVSLSDVRDDDLGFHSYPLGTAVHSPGLMIPPPWLSSDLANREKSLILRTSTKPPGLTVLGAFLAQATE